MSTTRQGREIQGRGEGREQDIESARSSRDILQGQDRVQNNNGGHGEGIQEGRIVDLKKDIDQNNVDAADRPEGKVRQR